MLNSEFRLLTESLGFYSSKSILKYLNNLDGYITLNERPIEYWLRGKKNSYDAVPNEIEKIFLSLKDFQNKILESELRKINNNLPLKFKYLFKNELYMWNVHPDFYGLPVTFLNQIVIRLGLSLDYYENNSVINQ